MIPTENKIEKLGKCYLDEMFASDPFLYESAITLKHAQSQNWLNDAWVASIVDLFPNANDLTHDKKENLSRWIKELTANFHQMQIDFLEAYNKGDRKALAITIRKECKNVLGFYTRNRPEKLLKNRRKVESVLAKKSELTLKFLRRLSIEARTSDYVKPNDIILGRVSEEAFLKFRDVLEAAIYVSNQFVKSGGGHKPVYTHMVVAFGELYYHITGNPPARIVEHYNTDGNIKEVENHPLLQIVQSVAVLIEDTLPRHLQSKGYPDLAKSPSPLLGLMQTADGNMLTTSHACKSGKRYRYYVSRDLKQGNSDTGWRIPAKMIENLVKTSLVQKLQNQEVVLSWLDTGSISAEMLPNLFCRANNFADIINNKQPHELRDLYRLLVRTVIVSKDDVKVECNSAYLEEVFEVLIKPTPIINIPIQIKRRGHEMKMVIGGTNLQTNIDNKLIKLVAQAHALRAGLIDGSIGSIIEFADEMNMHHADAKRLIPLGYLAPSIIEDILDGQQPADLTVSRLRRVNDLPLLWSEQRTYLGYSHI